MRISIGIGIAQMQRGVEPQYGPELIANGTMSAGTTGWTGARSNETLSVVGGRLRVTAIAAGAFGACTPITVPASGSHKYSAQFWDMTTGGACFFRGSDATLLASGGSRRFDVTMTGANGTTGEITRPPAADSYFVGGLAVAGAAGEYFEIDNVSVREVL